MTLFNYLVIFFTILKIGCEFEIEEGKSYVSIWREGREKGNDIIILQSPKIKEIILKSHFLCVFFLNIIDH